MSKTINDLITHIEEYNDAVIIVGDKVLKSLNLKTVAEEDKDIFNRKTLVKEPEKYWKWYYDELLMPYEKAFRTEAGEKVVDTLISIGYLCRNSSVKYNFLMTQEGSLSAYIPYVKRTLLKGSYSVIYCTKCNKPLSNSEDIIDPDFYMCQECNGRMRPSILMPGEKYNPSQIKKLKDAIFLEEPNKSPVLNTHTLIFIGVDFEEDLMHDIITSFNALKNNGREKRYSVIITEGDALALDYYEADFGTNYDIKESIDKLRALCTDKGLRY